MLQKKIAFIIPSLEMGGMERVMSQIVNYFSSKRLATEIHLIILTRNKKQFMIHPDVIIHEPDFDNSKLSFVVNSVKSIRYLRKIFKNIWTVGTMIFKMFDIIPWSFFVQCF